MFRASSQQIRILTSPQHLQHTMDAQEQAKKYLAIVRQKIGK